MAFKLTEAVRYAFIIPAATAVLAEPSVEIAVQGHEQLALLHAAGSQIYECRQGDDGKLAWQFREPIATLLQDGKTVGRHYAGPSWELTDGSAVSARPVAKAQSASPADIPLLKLEVTSHHGLGLLDSAKVIQRVNTKGGAHQGVCEDRGSLAIEPYESDYVFYK